MISRQTSSFTDDHVAEPADAAPVIRRLREIDMLVQSLVASWQPCESAVDRRRCHRLPFEHSIGVTPLVDDEPDGELQLALGRDISLGGIAFTHSEPIPNRHVAVTFWHEDGDVESVVTQLTWCRFTRQGDYQSGGKFLRMIELPNPTWDNRLRRA